MKKLILILCLALLAATSTAQQATLAVPVARASEDNYKVAEVVIRGNAGGFTPQVILTVSVQDSGGNEIRRFNLVIPDAARPGATVSGYITATHFTVRGGETGTDNRKANFRALGYFSDQGYLSGVTLVP